MRFHKSIKLKLLLTGLMIALVLFAVFGALLYSSLFQSYREDKLRTLISQQSVAVENIDRTYFQFVRLPYTFSSDETITRYLLSTAAKTRGYGRNLSDTMKDISLLTLSSNASDYMTKMVLVSSRHSRHIASGRVTGHVTDRQIFETLLEQHKNTSASIIVENPFYYAKNTPEKSVILLSEPIYYQSGSTQLGNLYIALSIDLVRDQFSSYLNSSQTPLYILSQDTVYVLTDSKVYEDKELLAALSSAAQTMDLQKGTGHTPPVTQLNGSILVATRSQFLGWTFLQPLSVYQPHLPMTPQVLLLFMLALLSVAVVYLLLNHIVAKPTAYIKNQLYALTLGDFTRQVPLDNRDEFGQISEDISQMAGAIEQLMITQLEDEKKRNQYAFQMLQNQINPHFLYNTLNSIRWLGEMNGVQGLGEMTTALMRMLRRVTGISTDWCTLGMEVEFVRDYEIIQSYRYGNAFHIRYRVDDPHCMQARIIKFILQPLIENAIFHGIDPTSTIGIIDIHAFQKGEDLVITVTDNGVGISPQRLEQLRYETYVSKNPGKTSSIALCNIHERLVMEYGKPYGLSMHSKENCYTQMILQMPLQIQSCEEKEPCIKS